jgi:hypothetical protein
VAKRKKSYHCTCLELNPGRPARSWIYLDIHTRTQVLEITCKA